MNLTKEEARVFVRLQIAMWLPAACSVCKKPYADVDDFMARTPRAGPGFGNPWNHDTAFIDAACWSGVAA